MYCRNCGRELFEGDNFCPACGTKVNKPTQETANREIVFDPDVVPETGEKFDFKWDLEDFNRQQRKTEDTATFDWGDLLGVKKEKDINDRISEASQLPGHGGKPVSDFVFDPSKALRPAESKPSEKFGSREGDFYTFNKKNAEFQELLNKEHERVKKAKEERALRIEELKLDNTNINEEIVLDEQTEEQPQNGESRLAARRRRKEAEKTESVPAADKTEIPLKVDEDDISGKWPEEPDAKPEAETESKPEEQEASETKQPVNQIEEMTRARDLLFNEGNIEGQLEKDAQQAQTPEKARVATQQISRDQFAEFLKKAEEQFGINDLDQQIEEESNAADNAEDVTEVFPETDSDAGEIESIQETPEESEEVPEAVEIPEEKPEPEQEPEEAQETEQAASATPDDTRKKRSRKVREETGEFHLGDFKDDNFWSSMPETSDEEETQKPVSKGSRVATVVIVVLAVLLAFQIALMIIRFQFPESAIAQIIEPKLTVIENWIRGIFS